MGIDEMLARFPAKKRALLRQRILALIAAFEAAPSEDDLPFLGVASLRTKRETKRNGYPRT